MNRTLLVAVVAGIGISSVAQATPPAPVPIHPGAAAGLIIANELARPKPFCKVIKLFKKKKRCA